MNRIYKTLTKDAPSIEITSSEGKYVQLIKVFSNNEYNFIQHPSLTLEVVINNMSETQSMSWSLTSFIRFNQVQARVVEFDNFVLPIKDSIKISITDKDENTDKDFNIDLSYEIRQ